MVIVQNKINYPHSLNVSVTTLDYMEVKSEEQFLTITPSAKEQIENVIAQQEADDLFLRIYVQGGCGGIQYGMAIDKRFQQGDSEFEINGLKVVVDKLSRSYVKDTTVDFDNTSEKPGFRITHPNPEILAPAGSCGSGACGSGGCGTSSGGCC